MNALDLISSSMRLIGATASGETCTSAEASDGLFVLDQMLDSWNADRLAIFTITIATFPLVSFQQVYTLGAGGNFNIERPARIDGASIVSLTNPGQPLELPIAMYSDTDWQAIPVKNITSTLPQGIYDDGGYPFRNLSFCPIPTAAVNVIIYMWGPLASFPDLVTNINFPPGYAEALRYNLAMRLIAEMPGNYNPLMVQVTGELAVSSLARIRSMNMPVVESFVDDALVNRGGRYNYISDMPVGGRNQ
jgi:hypothetical protein